MSLRRPLVVFLLVAAVDATACGKTEVTVPDVSGRAAAPSPPAPATWHLRVLATSSVDVAGTAAGAPLQAAFTGVQGSIEFPHADLTQMRGAVDVDLASFASHASGGAGDANESKEGKEWLEVSVTKMRWAHLAIASVDGVSAKSIADVPATKEGDEDIRTVSITVHGDLLIHGHKLAKAVPLAVTFHHRRGADATSIPLRVDLTTKEPLVVTRKEIDLVPRDASGKAVKLAPAALAKVPESVRLTASLHAEP